MAYAHCHNCGWEQDDYWHDSYHPLPLGSMKELNNKLLAAVEDPSKRMVDGYDKHFLEESFGTKHEVDVREFVAVELERRARNIRGMHFWTDKDFSKDHRCPKCGSSKHLDVD